MLLIQLNVGRDWSEDYLHLCCLNPFKWYEPKPFIRFIMYNVRLLLSFPAEKCKDNHINISHI